MSFPDLFTSTKADGNDATLLQPSQWNAVVTILTGLLHTPSDADGTLLVRDSTSDTGATWRRVLTHPTQSSLILRSGSILEGNNQSALVVARGSNGASALTFIDAYGAYHTNASINIRGDFAEMGSLDADGTFHPINTTPVANLASMMQIISDTNIGLVLRSEDTPGNYAVQLLQTPDGVQNTFVWSLLADGTLSWGGGASHAAEDVTLGRSAAGTLLLKGGAAPSLYIGNTSTDADSLTYSAAGLAIRRISGASVTSVLDVATIAPASGFDFTVKQNSVNSFQVIQASAVDSTLVIKAGRVGFGTGTPNGAFDLLDGSGHVIIGNNSFGNDWMVFTQDTALGSGKYFLAAATATGTLLNANTGKSISLRVNNSEVLHVSASDLVIALASLPTSAPGVSGQVWRNSNVLTIVP